ncbi:MAG: PhoX family protein [Actinomycetota bacterium]|nr:PhoX family protein [Actinomycetota bacterium]
MTQVDRRTVLKAGAVTALAGPFAGFFARQASAAPPSAAAGPALVPTPDLRDGVERLALPRGLSYRSFQHATVDTFQGGIPVPSRHDGMAAFPGPNGASLLVRNHEILGPGTPLAPTPAPYDSAAAGGTINTLVTGEGIVLASRASLTGTMANCAGGPMPWGSWVTCEETINGPDVFDDFTRGSAPPETYQQNVQLQQKHGYVFEVPSDGVSDGQPIRATGRFSHEAIAYSPNEDVFYLTEDDFGFPSGFYRYVPPRRPGPTRRLRDGGRLFMLAVQGVPRARLEAAKTVGLRLPVRWVEIANPDPTFPMDTSGDTPVPTVTNDEAIHAVAEQGWVQGAAYFSRLEGATYAGDTVYFTSTQGGGDRAPWSLGDPAVPFPGFGNGFGQIWAYHTQRQELELVYVSPGPDVLDFPDNITTRAGALVICEDSTSGNYVRVLAPNGALFDLAQNLIPKPITGGNDIGGEEFAGSTFSPDGRTLYVNIQASQGMSFAIFGDWSVLGL